MRLKVVLATRNRAKAEEYSLLFKDAPIELTTLAEQNVSTEIEETGHTIEENARLKALGYAAASGLLVLADDSGLEVDALGGEPGSLSARYAGENASDAERIALLLSRLEGVPWEKRSARFRCVIAVASGPELLRVCQGECEGIISLEPRGTSGFGYDPVFYVPELDRTMAELSMEEKNRVSHRGRAARKALEFLAHYASGE
ncbi:MAG: non-canonical purine NTP pyrophosphatase [Chloroflexi bacterium]|nr:MAG: non-canonical purine NTP pyrophosphatase [Chloroflexota bacterium]